jgi:hypothetical protein
MADASELILKEIPHQQRYRLVGSTSSKQTNIDATASRMNLEESIWMNIVYGTVTLPFI